MVHLSRYIWCLAAKYRYKLLSRDIEIDGDLCKIPLFTFSLTARTQTQIFGYFRLPNTS